LEEINGRRDGVKGGRKMEEGGREGGQKKETYLVQVPNLLFQGREEVEGNQLGGFLGLFWRNVRAYFTRHELAFGVRGEVAGCVCVRVLREDG